MLASHNMDLTPSDKASRRRPRTDASSVSKQQALCSTGVVTALPWTYCSRAFFGVVRRWQVSQSETVSPRCGTLVVTRSRVMPPRKTW